MLVAKLTSICPSLTLIYLSVTALTRRFLRSTLDLLRSTTVHFFYVDLVAFKTQLNMLKP